MSPLTFLTTSHCANHDLSLCSLSATRKKRKPAPDAATPAEIKTYTETSNIPSVHGTKPPGISALALAKEATVTVTGG